MSVAARDLRNHTADVLRQVESGERVTITVRGKPVAELVPIRATRPATMSRAQLLEILRTSQADAGLTRDLELLAGDTTDDLDPL